MDFNDHEYPEIKRKIGHSKIRQIDRLIDTAANWGWPAVYAFYNHLDEGNRLPQNCGTLRIAGISSIDDSWGISIADAYQVRIALDDQTFDTHRHHSRPLHCLLCSHGKGTRDPGGSPAMALNGLIALRASGPPPHIDGVYPSLPDAPLRELPLIFQIAKEVGQAREVSMKGGLDQRAAQLRGLAEKFPGIAGVVILRDAEVRK